MRSSVDRWTRLSRLLLTLERTCAGAARLDTYDPPRHIDACWIDQRIRSLEAALDHELDRVTAELLMAQLRAKQRERAA